MARDRDVAVATAVLEGDPVRDILREVDRCHLLLIGRTGRAGTGSPMVGSLAMHLTEFTNWPVIVPEPR